MKCRHSPDAPGAASVGEATGHPADFRKASQQKAPSLDERSVHQRPGREEGSPGVDKGDPGDGWGGTARRLDPAMLNLPIAVPLLSESFTT